MKQKIKDYIKPVSLALLLLWLIGLVLSRANPYFTLPSADGGSFLYIGNRMLAGDELYVDVWDHKGPGIFFVNWLGVMLVNNSRWGVWFIEFFALYFGFLLGYLGIRKKWGEDAALIGLIISAYSLISVFEKGNLTEEYPLLFNFFALWLFFTQKEKKPFLIYALIGVSFCMAFMFRANNGGTQIAVGITTLIAGLLRQDYPKLFKQMAGLASGTIGSLLLILLFFHSRGTLQFFIDAAFTYNFLDVSGSTDIVSGFLKGWGFFGAASYLMVLGYFAALYRLYVLITKKQSADAESETLILIATLWPLEILLSSLSGRNYSHYFVCWIPTIFILTSYAYRIFSPTVFTTKVLNFINTTKVYYAVLVVSMLFAMPVIRNYSDAFNVLLFNRAYGIDQRHELSEYIRNNTKPDEKVLIWGWGAGMNFLSRREAPTSHIFYPLPSDNRINAELSKKFYEDLINNKPVLVVDMSSTNPDYLTSINPTLRAEQAHKHMRNYYPPYYHEVLDYIIENYRLEKNVKGYDIYRLKTP